MTFCLVFVVVVVFFEAVQRTSTDTLYVFPLKILQIVPTWSRIKEKGVHVKKREDEDKRREKREGEEGKEE